MAPLSTLKWVSTDFALTSGHPSRLTLRLEPWNIPRAAASRTLRFQSISYRDGRMSSFDTSQRPFTLAADTRNAGTKTWPQSNQFPGTFRADRSPIELTKAADRKLAPYYWFI